MQKAMLVRLIKMETENDFLYDSISKDVCDPTKDWADIVKHIDDLSL